MLYTHKKIISFIIIFIAIISISNINFADEIVKDISKKESYNNFNADSTPEFYGTIAINLNIGDILDLENSTFRIFAKDSIDGDLTHNIKIIENNVNTNQEGEYYIKYEVTNSIGKSSNIIVPVKISNSQERTIQRRLYSLSDSSTKIWGASNRGFGHDRQNLGIYMKAGSSIKVRRISGEQSYTVSGDLLNNDSETEEKFKVLEEWSTITADYDSVPFIQSSEVKNKNVYQITEEADYGLWNIEYFGKNEVDGTLFFANIFDRKDNNDELTYIKVPVYGCDEVEIYVNTIDGDINSDNYTLIKKSVNPTAGWLEVTLREPIKIQNEKFIVAVKYTGDTVPINIYSKCDNYTYVSNSLNNNWELLKGSHNDGDTVKYTNIPPITCYGKEQGYNNTIIEINIDDMYSENPKIKPLTYYLDGDDESSFMAEWRNNRDSYAVMENDRVTFLVPIKDINNITSTSNDPYYFSTISELFEYYNDFLRQYDLFLGVDFFAEDDINKNTREKYFVKANKHGAGMAYYGYEHTAYNGDNLRYYFYKNWMILHEFGHGYEGEFSSKDLDLSEVANNIFAYYYEQTYIKENDYGWLGSISENEESFQEIRRNIETFNDLANSSLTYESRLYFFVNLLNKIGPEKAMSTLYQNLRLNNYNDTNMSMADLIAISFADCSGYNIVPYLESWKVDISDSVKESIRNKGGQALYYLKDLAQNDVLARKIYEKYNLDGIYALVTEEEYNEYALKTIINIEIINPKEVEVFIGESIDTTDLGIIVNYYDGTSQTILEGFEVEDYNINELGMQSVYIDYKGVKCSYIINVIEHEIVGINLKSPQKKDYIEGEQLDLSGIEVILVYDNGVTKILSDGYIVGGYDPNKTGEQIITVSYGGVEATYTINVNAKIITGIEVKPPIKLEYKVGEPIDLTGLNLTVNYNNNTSEVISEGYFVSGYNSYKEGNQIVTVKYGNFQQDFEIQVLNDNHYENVVLKSEKLDVGIFDNTIDGKKILSVVPKSEYLGSEHLYYNEIAQIFTENNIVIDLINGSKVSVNLNTMIVRTGDIIVDVNNNKYIVILYGDANSDGSICNAFDLNVIISEYLHIRQFSKEQKIAANLYIDNSLNAFDLNRMTSKYLGYDGHYGSKDKNTLGRALTQIDIFEEYKNKVKENVFSK